MRIKDLLNVEKAIKAKNIELEEKKQELERLRQEAEELKLIVDINNRQYADNELINISDIYMLVNKTEGGRVHFVKKVVTSVYRYNLVDIFTNECCGLFSGFELIDMSNNVNQYYLCQTIREAFPETLVYLDGRVPKLLLQKLYYKANGIDEKVLKIGAMKE